MPMEKTIFFDISLYFSLIGAVMFAIHYLSHKPLWRWVALMKMFFSFAGLTVFIIQRWIMAGYPPFANTFESMVFFAWAVLLILLVIELAYRPPLLSAVVGLMVVFTLAYAHLAFPSGIRPLMPALQNSFWLTIHVVVCFIGYAAFMVAFVSGLLYLYGAEKRYLRIASFVTSFALLGIIGGLVLVLVQRGNAAGVEPLKLGKVITYLVYWLIASIAMYFPIALIITRLRFQDKPEFGQKQYSLMTKAIAFGFPFLTLGIITGSVWANQAWGRYWGWDPKETWALITWIIFSIFLHLKYAGGWMGIKPKHLPYIRALIAVIGFLAVIFTFFGVNYLLSGLHSYA